LDWLKEKCLSKSEDESRFIANRGLSCTWDCTKNRGTINHVVYLSLELSMEVLKIDV